MGTDCLCPTNQGTPKSPLLRASRLPLTLAAARLSEHWALGEGLPAKSIHKWNKGSVKLHLSQGRPCFLNSNEDPMNGSQKCSHWLCNCQLGAVLPQLRKKGPPWSPSPQTCQVGVSGRRRVPAYRILPAHRGSLSPSSALQLLQQYFSAPCDPMMELSFPKVT